MSNHGGPKTTQHDREIGRSEEFEIAPMEHSSLGGARGLHLVGAGLRAADPAGIYGIFSSGLASTSC